MKKSKYMKTIRISIYALMLLAGASCMKAEQEISAPVTDDTSVLSFKALGSQVESKVSLKENGTSVNWTAGDQVAVADGSGDIYKFASQENGASVTFRYQPDGEKECFFNKSAEKYLMTYPWTPSGTIDVARGIVTTSLPAVQNAVKDNFEGAYAVAVAGGNDFEDSFTFSCAVSMLKVEIPEDLNGKIAELVVRGNAEGENLVGDLEISCTEDGPVTTLGARKYTEVRLVPETGTLEAGTYYIAIAPVTVSRGLEVVAVSTDNFSEFEISTAKGQKTFEPGVIYNLGTLNAEKIEFEQGGVGRLPYVFPFFAKAGTGNNPKYLTQTVVEKNTHLRLTDEKTGSEFNTKTTGSYAVYWSNSYAGHDNVLGAYFTTKESAGDAHKDSYFMLSVPLRMSLPETFRVSFGFFIDSAKPEPIKDWKLQYSKDAAFWHDGATFEFPSILKYYSAEIDSEETFSSGDKLYLRWIPVGKMNWNGGTTTGMENDTRVQFATGVVISEVESPASDLSGNVYAEDFDHINGGVDYRHAGQENGIEKLGLLGELYGADISSWTAEQKKGMTGTRVVERPGYVQIGHATYANDNRNSSGTNQVGSLVTPELTDASGTIYLSFKAMCYRSPFIGREKMSGAPQTDVTDVVVNIKGAGSFREASPVTTMTLSDISTNKFDTRTLTIYNTDATTRIEFTSNAVAGKFTRWFLDDICISKRNN